jgi:hypothetical protein
MALDAVSWRANRQKIDFPRAGEALFCRERFPNSARDTGMSSPHFGTALRRWLHSISGSTNGEASDGQLLERFVQQRDESAFAALVRRHGPLVHGVCGRLAASDHDAEDVFQATFLVLACRAAAIRRRRSVASFLYGTTLRIARHLRTQNARRGALDEWH